MMGTVMQDINARVDAMERRELEEEFWKHSLRPSTNWKPVVTLDGDQWCALYGDNLQVGVAGFGDSPALALVQFDIAWRRKVVRLPDNAELCGGTSATNV